MRNISETALGFVCCGVIFFIIIVILILAILGNDKKRENKQVNNSSRMYYTRHQSLKHIWYQRYNIRTSSRYDGVVPWYEKKGFKRDAWGAGCDAAWKQLMTEREELYNNENIAEAEIVDITKNPSGSIKLWVNVNNPYAEKWDFGDINCVTIRKSKENLFKDVYGNPEIGKMLFVTLKVYHKKGATGLSYKINYEKTDFQDNFDYISFNKSENRDGDLQSPFLEHKKHDPGRDRFSIATDSDISSTSKEILTEVQNKPGRVKEQKEED